jgi:ribosome-associated toxin RatA of RatAB toxin-antitoxin module
MKSAIAVEIGAPPDLVFDLARDVERWPAMLPHYASVRVRDRRPDGSLVARFVARRELLPILGLGLPVAWRALAWSEPEALRLRFRHLGGVTAGMDVTWRITPAPSGCRVTIEHDFRPRFGAWAAIVDRAFVRPIAGRTLATFRAIAEAASGSGGRPATNLPL